MIPKDFIPLFEFEKTIAEYYGAPYGVAVDCCTHALELCLRLKDYPYATLPYRTYISIPFMLQKINMRWTWKNESWLYYYYLQHDIIDAAVWFKENGYIKGTKMCLSFHIKKPIAIGRGGMILLDNKEEYEKLIKMRYDGRSIYNGELYNTEDVDTIGYHYYMTPETAAYGLEIFNSLKDKSTPQIGHNAYRDLREFTALKKM